MDYHVAMTRNGLAVYIASWMNLINTEKKQIAKETVTMMIAFIKSKTCRATLCIIYLVKLQGYMRR